MSFLEPKIKGSLVVGRGNGSVRLPVGADDTILKADSGATPGLSWAVQPSFSARFPIWMFGNAEDGSITLAMDTVLAAETPMVRYLDLDLNGFALENDASGIVLIAYVQNELDLNGGELRGGFQNSGGAGGAAGGVTAGAGGQGGRGRSGVWVFAQSIIGTGRIHSDGEDGQAGGAASVNAANAPQTLGTAGGQNSITYYLQGITQSTSTGNGGSPSTIAYTGGAGGSAGTGILTVGTVNQWKDHLAIIFNVYPTSASFATPISADNWGRAAGPGLDGAGGGGGTEAEGNTGAGATGEGGPGGGGGSAGFGSSGAGGDGGNGNGQDAAATTGASSGGGGGGGAGGGFVCVLSNSVPSTLSVSSDGGDGGVGADGIVAPSGRESGGAGGGGGGAGGMALLVAQSGNGAAVTAAKGTGSTGGAPGGAGSTAGAFGADGEPGVVFDLTFN